MTDKTDNRETWRSAFDERHEFDVYPDHFMAGLRNEFCAGWHAAMKSQADSQPKALTAEQIARAIWSIRREDEDRCDMELEDMSKGHSVWKEAAAVLALLEATK